MKLGLFVCVISLFIPFILHAQEDSTSVGETKREVFIAGGLSYPYLPKTLDVNYKPGMNIGAGMSLKLAPGSLGYSKVSLAFEYNLFNFDEQSFLGSFENTEDTLILQQNPGLTASQRPAKIFTAMLNYQGTFTVVSEVVSPYFLLGVGFIYMSVPPLYTYPTTALEQDGYNKATVSWSFGLGVDIPITDSFGTFIQGRSVIGVLNDTHQYFPINLGVRYTLP